MKCSLQRRLVLPTVRTLAALLVGTAAACPPERQLAVVVPYAAGGSLDATVRVVATGAAQELGRPIQVVNVPGASGLLAVRQVLAAERDGCALLAATIDTMILLPLLNPRAGFGSADFKPVARIGSTDMVLVASPLSGLHSLQALLDPAAQGQPDLRAGHPGHETLQALVLRQLRPRLARPLIEVPYAGGTAIVAALIGGHLDIAILARPVAQPLLRRAALIGLADPIELDQQPGAAWSALFVARGVPEAAVAELARAVHAALRSQQLQRTLADLGVAADSAGDRVGFARDAALTASLLGAQFGPRNQASGR